MSYSYADLARFPTLPQVGPWTQASVILEDLGPHRRLGPHEGDGFVWPGWVHQFDRWVGRLDGTGETNLVLLPDNSVTSIDYGLVFPWAIGWKAYARRPDLMDVPVHPRVFAASDPATREAIQALSDGDLWNVVVGGGLPIELAPTGRLVAYWSGLCLRRDLL